MIKYFIFFCCFISISAKAQNSANKQAQKNFDQAQVFLSQNNYEQGIKYLKEAVKIDPLFQSAYTQLGDSFSRLKSYPDAKKYYKKAIGSFKNIDARLYFALGESELLTGDYEQAKINFNYFEQKFTGNNQEIINLNRKYILDCDFALKAIENPTKYKPINLGRNINSSNREYFPTITADGETIIFTRVIEGNEDFFTSNKQDNEWLKAWPLSNAINTSNYNEGAQSISPDGKYLFFTGCNRPDGLGRCDIYIARKDGNNWGKATNLGKIINSEYWESQPAISPDGNTLYFVSNRPGGFGGYDIWKSILSDESGWNEPVNLGITINTPFDENTPFIHADGKTLYFSSDGWPGLGNKDIFFSRMQNDGFFSEPINLGYPINTFNEEIGLIVTADGSEGLFSSNKIDDGFGDLDIYSFKLPEQIKPLPITYVKGIVKDSATNEILEATVLVIDLKTNNTIFNDDTSNENGEFLAVMPIGSDYSLNANAEGYLFNSVNFSLNQNNTNVPYKVEILLNKIAVGKSVALQNVFFDTNKFNLLPNSVNELSLLIDLLKNNPNLIIELQGHTDNVGDERMNQNLSENRAKSVYDFLINNGIEKNRLTYKGYGATIPRSDNNTELGRQQNRRTEFIITKI